MGLTSWLEKGLNSAASDELTALQARIQSMVDKNIKLVNVIQVMLVCQILPCQSRTCNLWEFDPAEYQPLQHFFGVTHECIWKVLFKANETWPKETEDRGYNLTHPASPVSFSHFKVNLLLTYSGKMPEPPIYFCRVGPRKRSGSSVRLLFSRNRSSRF